MKSKRFKAGIFRMKIPDESSSAANAVSKEVIKSYKIYLNKEKSGVYCPGSILFNL